MCGGMFSWSLTSKADVSGGKMSREMCSSKDSFWGHYSELCPDRWGSFLARKAEPVKIWITGVRRYTIGSHGIWTGVPGVLHLGEECLCAENSSWDKTTSKQSTTKLQEDWDVTRVEEIMRY